MLAAMLRFHELPEIGFAHHYYAEAYTEQYRRAQQSFELVYVKSGDIAGSFNGKEFSVQSGSVFVLFRHLPLRLTSANGAPQAHCSVQLSMPYEFTMLEERDRVPEDFDGIILPFVTEPCAETEQIKKELYAIVSDLGVSREENRFAASLAAAGILERLNRLYRKKLFSAKGTASVLSYRIKRYVAEHLHKTITLAELATELGKTPNYLNAVFKEANGITIHQYVNREKVRTIAGLMENKSLSFQGACENVAISDASYGYRLFKKHTGITPGAYLAGERFRRDFG